MVSVLKGASATWLSVSSHAEDGMRQARGRISAVLQRLWRQTVSRGLETGRRSFLVALMVHIAGGLVGVETSCLPAV